MIELLDVNFAYKKNEEILSKINLKINQGECWGVLGHNGAGKTTLSYLIMKLLSPSAGRVTNNSTNCDYLPEFGGFYNYLTILQNLEFKMSLSPAASPVDLDNLLIKLGLFDFKNKLASKLSQGQKKRLAIGLIIISDKDFIYLDEPTNGLDPQGIRQIRDIIKVIASQGTTILLASHLLDEVEKVCSHVVVLRKGEMLYQGSVHDMIENNSFFELKSDDKEQLKLALQNHPSVEKIEEEAGKVLVYLNQDIAAKDLNSYLFERKIVLEHLVKRKNSLEEQFLELTKN